MADDSLPPAPEPEPERRDTRFKPGNKGRPPGRSMRVRLLDEMAHGEADAIVRKLVGRALADPPDIRAAELILRRVWPEPRGRPFEFALPKLTDAKSVAAAFSKLVAGMARGELEPAQAAEVAAVLGAFSKTVTDGALMDEVEALRALAEARSGEMPKARLPEDED